MVRKVRGNKGETKVGTSVADGAPVENEKVEIGNGNIKIKLSKKINFNDMTIERVDLDFEALTGKDICDAESDFRGEFLQPILDPNYSMAYQAAVAAKASGLPYEVILGLSPKDFAKVVEVSRGFLMA